MNFIRKPLMLLGAALMALPLCSMAQYRFQVEPFFNYFSDAGRYEIGGSYILPTAQIAGDNQATGQGLFLGDTTLNRAATGSGVGGFIGISVPIKATGHISCWAAHFELMVNDYTWTNVNQTYEPNSGGKFVNATPALGAATMQIALPVGLEWKVGCDAILSKRLNFGTTLGAGVIPSYNMTSLQNATGSTNSGSAFGCTPYVKAEGSTFIGMCVKIRVMYTIGDIQLIDQAKAISNMTDGPFRITSNSDLIVSLILMPFSGKWRESDWTNTYDTYNKHDRLN